MYRESKPQRTAGIRVWSAHPYPLHWLQTAFLSKAKHSEDMDFADTTLLQHLLLKTGWCQASQKTSGVKASVPTTDFNINLQTYKIDI